MLIPVILWKKKSRPIKSLFESLGSAKFWEVRHSLTFLWMYLLRIYLSIVWGLTLPLFPAVFMPDCYSQCWAMVAAALDVTLGDFGNNFTVRFTYQWWGPAIVTPARSRIDVTSFKWLSSRTEAKYTTDIPKKAVIFSYRGARLPVGDCARVCTLEWAPALSRLPTILYCISSWKITI